MIKKMFPLLALAMTSSVSVALAQEPADSVPVMDDGMLDEVVVTAAKPVISTTAEGTVYDVTEDPEAQALTLLDLMRKIPGVMVDGQDNVTLNGSSDFMVQVDGRDMPMFKQNTGKIMKSIPASSVLKVEVITSPGARYDAEGVGGVINIVMTRKTENLDGYSLTISGEGSNYGGNGTAYAMMQKGRVGATVNLNTGYNEMGDIFIDMFREQAGGGSLDYRGKQHNRGHWRRADLNLSIRLSAADNLQLSGSYNGYNWSNIQHSNVAMFMQGSVADAYFMYSRAKSIANYANAGMDYTHIFGGDSRNKLRVGYQFDTQPSKNKNTVDYSDNAEYAGLFNIPTDYSTENRSNMPQHIALAEYTLPVGDMHTFELGTKMTWRNATSHAAYLDYTHRSRIAAGFFSYALTAGDFSAKAGLRYEHTYQKALFHLGAGENFKADYSNLVPSASVAYRFSNFSTLSAAYSQRISRPGINYLNPYVDTDNPLNIRTGNPYLTPERHNNLTVSYQNMWGPLLLTAKGNYSFCTDGITNISTITEGIIHTTYINGLHSRRANLQLFGNLHLSEKTNITLSVDPGFVSMSAAGLGNHGWNLNAFCQVQQQLPWRLNLSAMAYLMTPYIQLQGRGMSQFIHMLTLSRPFLKEDRLNVSIMAMNPFYSRMNVRMTEYGRDYTQRIDGHMHMQMFQVSVSLRLGNLKQRVNTRENIEGDATDASSSQGISPKVGM